MGAPEQLANRTRSREGRMSEQQRQQAAVTRVYVVRQGEQYRLVRAANRAQARAHVARETIFADLASQDDLIRLVGEGLTVEQAGDEPTTEQLPLAAD
jgi:hypothetical protein